MYTIVYARLSQTRLRMGILYSLPFNKKGIKEIYNLYVRYIRFDKIVLVIFS
jgi:hypothetical protein